MGAGAIFLIALLIALAVIAALVFSGIGAGLWAKRTEPGEETAGPDSVDEEMTRVDTPGRKPPPGAAPG